MKNFSLEHLVRHPENSEGKAPLLLMLHGYGSNEEDLFSFASELPEELLIVSARAPLTLGYGSYAWYTIHFERDSANFSDIPEAMSALSTIDKFLDEVLEHYHADPGRVFLLGFSQGTILSSAYALNHPGKVHHVIALSGYINSQLIRGTLESGTFHELDFFVSHGSVDQVIPVEWARKTGPFLDRLKIPFTYMEYPVGHGVAPQNFFDLLHWLKQRL